MTNANQAERVAGNSSMVGAQKSRAIICDEETPDLLSAEAHSELDVDALAFDFVKQLAAELSEDELDLPSLPGVVARAKAVLDDENSTQEMISRVIGCEPTLAARLLAFANSAAFSRGGIEITDLKTAISRLGRDTVQSSTMSYAMQSMMNARAAAKLKPRLNALWKHSIKVAAIAYSLAKRTEEVSPDAAMFVGLIHDIGKLYILTRLETFPALYESPTTLAHIMNDWHSQIGKSIAEHWNLPEHVAMVIGEHEHEEREKYGQADILDALIAANLVAKAQLENKMESLDFENISAFARLGIDASNISSVVEESRAEVDAVMNALRA